MKRKFAKSLSIPLLQGFSKVYNQYYLLLYAQLPSNIIELYLDSQRRNLIEMKATSEESSKGKTKKEFLSLFNLGPTTESSQNSLILKPVKYTRSYVKHLMKKWIPFNY